MWWDFSGLTSWHSSISLALTVVYPRGRRVLKASFLTVPVSSQKNLLRLRKCFSKTRTQTWVSKFQTPSSSKAISAFLFFLIRSSIPIVTLYAGYSASQLALFYSTSMQWFHTKTLPLSVSSPDLQLGKLIQTAFMWHWGFPVIWFPCLCSAGHPRFYELIPVVHFSAVTHEQSTSLFIPRTPFYIWKSL